MKESKDGTCVHRQSIRDSTRGAQNCCTISGAGGIGVFNVKGSFYALRNICPHKQGPLCMGELSGRAITDAPPSIPEAMLTIEGDGEVLRCPWHFWPYDIATGQCLVDPDIRVQTYPIKVEGDEIIVDVEVKDFEDV